MTPGSVTSLGSVLEMSTIRLKNGATKGNKKKNQPRSIGLAKDNLRGGIVRNRPVGRFFCVFCVLCWVCFRACRLEPSPGWSVVQETRGGVLV